MRAARLQQEQLDKKLTAPVHALVLPGSGWIHALRGALRISLRQLGARLGVSAQTVKSFERGELSGAVTLGTLRRVADAMDMDLVYAFVPRAGSFDAQLERQARRVAASIVSRSATSMQLEDQGVSDEHIKAEIDELSKSLKTELPRHLWD